MTKIKILITSLSVITMLTACGEGFKAKLLGSEAELNQTVEGDKNNIPQATGPVSKYEEVAMSYESDFRGLTQADSVALATSVKAFDIELKINSHPGGASDVLQSIVGKLRTSCTSLSTFTGSNVNLSQLKSMQRVSLGSQGSYDVDLQCIDSNCNEIVAAIHRHGDITEGIILLSLKKSSSLVSGTLTTSKYIVQDVKIPIFYANALTISNYEFRCLQNINAQPTTTTTVNPTLGGTTTGSQNTGTNAFGVTGNTAPYYNFDTPGTPF